MARINAASALLGAGGLGLVLLASGALQAIPPWSYHGKTVELGPDAWRFVQVREGTPFVVPAGNLFVLTALGSGSLIAAGGLAPVEVSADGQSLDSVHVGATLSMRSMSFGPTAKAGSVVTVSGGFFGEFDASAWGYLVIQPPPGTPSASAAWITYGPHPADLFIIQAGTPFVVPAHKVFVVTAFGGFGGAPLTGYSRLHFDGVPALTTSQSLTYDGYLRAVPTGLSAKGGTTVAVVDLDPIGIPVGTSYGRCWGYLANR